MKYLGLLLLVFITAACEGQVTFKLYKKRLCNNTTVLDSSGFYLIREGADILKDSSFYQSKNGVAKLPGKGRYYLMGVYAFYEQDEHVIIEVKDNTSVVDYLYVERAITLAFAGMENAAAYRRCDVLLNGYNEDFHPNGKPHISGNFANGYFKDSIRVFYNNGILKTHKFRFSRGLVIEKFDSLGHKLSVVQISKKRPNHRQKYKTTEFFENGTIRLVKVEKGDFVYIEEFYPAGQLKLRQDKKERVEYFEDGKVQIAYTWKFKYDKRVEDYDCLINKDEYDANGQLVEHSEYDYWVGKSKYLPKLDLAKADWVKLSIKYKDGKEISRLINKD